MAATDPAGCSCSRFANAIPTGASLEALIANKIASSSGLGCYTCYDKHAWKERGASLFIVFAPPYNPRSLSPVGMPEKSFPLGGKCMCSGARKALAFLSALYHGLMLLLWAFAWKTSQAER